VTAEKNGFHERKTTQGEIVLLWRLVSSNKLKQQVILKNSRLSFCQPCLCRHESDSSAYALKAKLPAAYLLLTTKPGVNFRSRNYRNCIK